MDLDAYRYRDRGGDPSNIVSHARAQRLIYLRHHLEQRLGQAWFEQPEAGTLLKRLWSHGQRPTAEELLGELTGEELDFGVLLHDLGLEVPGARDALPS